MLILYKVDIKIPADIVTSLDAQMRDSLFSITLRFRKLVTYFHQWYGFINYAVQSPNYVRKIIKN